MTDLIKLSEQLDRIENQQKEILEFLIVFKKDVYSNLITIAERFDIAIKETKNQP